MALTTGSRLGPYEIVSRIGAGGMGEVFRARDTRFDRSVAIKVLPAASGANAESLLRFEREGKAISQLNHPNICTLHDVGHVDGVDYLVMELLDGHSLADRIARGALPVADVLRYGAEIARALDRAHRAGIVHRDLKPGNIMITKSGAKLLDFGLARSLSPAAAPADATQQKPLTAEGTVLGTYPYMGPEQLAGEASDARTDIFAFGAVLYEMLTGTRAFEGKNKTSVIAAVLSGQPRPIAQLQPLTPPALEHIVAKCLAKDPDERWQSAADIAHELEWIRNAAGRPVPPLRRSKSGVAIAAAVAAALAVGALASWYIKPAARIARATRLTIPLPPNTSTLSFAERGMAISPDGSRLVIALFNDNVAQLWLRSFDNGSITPIPDTKDASYPFWSPDGEFIAFFADGKLKKVPAAGGAPQVICDAPSGRGGSWSGDGTILFAPKYWLSPIARVSAAGGTPATITSFDAAHEFTHRFPIVLPDGRHFLYVSRVKPDRGGYARGQIIGASLDSHEPQLVIDNASNPTYIAPGWLLFVRERSLMAAPFDARKMRVTGDPIALPIGRVGCYENRNYGFYTAAQDGTLVFLPPNTPAVQLRWFDAKGNPGMAEDQPAYYVSAMLSRDGKRLVLARSDDGLLAHTDLWVHELGSSNSSRITFDGHYEFARWSPDGKRLYYNCEKNGVYDLYRRSLNGPAVEEPLYVSAQWKDTFDVSPDEKFVITEEQFPLTETDLLSVRLADRSIATFLRTPTSDEEPAFSPDGRWIAFVSDGRVCVRRFPDSGEQWQVSSRPGASPQWSGDGKTIFYQTPDGMITAVVLRFGDAVEPGNPMPLFRVPATAMPDGGASPFFAVSRDGQRFLVGVATEESTTLPLQVVLNWPALLQKK
jgi:serine/threonine protein kinase